MVENSSPLHITPYDVLTGKTLRSDWELLNLWLSLAFQSARTFFWTLYQVICTSNESSSRTSACHKLSTLHTEVAWTITNQYFIVFTKYLWCIFIWIVLSLNSNINAINRRCHILYFLYFISFVTDWEYINYHWQFCIFTHIRRQTHY